MTQNILLNRLSVVNAIAQAKIANSLIDTSKENWTKQGENSVALEAFSEQFDELQKIIETYQTLLDRDLNAASEAANEIIASDLIISSLWR